MKKLALSIVPAVGMRDKRLSHAQRNLLSILGIYANRNTGWCWPSVTTLANDLGSNQRHVRRHLARLVELGYIERYVKSGKSWGTRIIYDVGQESLPFEEVVPPGQNGPTPRAKMAPPPRAKIAPQNVPMNAPLNESSSEPSSTYESNHEIQSPKGDNAQLVLSAASQPLDLEISFEEWWFHWAMPGTKRGKGQAKRAYLRIIRKNEVTAQELIDGVKRYMVHCHRNAIPIQFIKHPATWLNGQCWKDDLIDDQPDNRRNGNGIESAAAIAESIIREIGDPDSLVYDADLFGEGDSQHPDSSHRSDLGGKDCGDGMHEVPPRFDQEADR